MKMFDEFIENLPDYAKDLRLNAKSLILSPSDLLSEKQISAIVIACAISTKNFNFYKIVKDKFSSILTKEELNAIKGCALIMGMNNTYYKSLSLIENNSYKSMPVGLRMNIMANHGIKEEDFELAALAVSVMSGCGICVDSHEKKLKSSMSCEAIQHAIKIAAIINALSLINIVD